MALDFSRSRLRPFKHQIEDTERLVNSPYLFITSEMRTGKSKIIVDAAQFMFEMSMIDQVIIVAPAPVRDVWFDQTLGEIAKHSWLDLPSNVSEFHARTRTWSHGGSGARLRWIVTNYEFLRSKNRLTQLLPYATPRTLLVLDESSFIKGADAQQTKACLQLRRQCGRVVLLNGTPISHNPMDLFSQGNMLHPSILDCKYVTHYKIKYAKMELLLGKNGKPLPGPRGRGIQKIVGWQNLDDLQRRFAPYTIRRLQKDCLDLPPKLDPVTLTATLTPATWKIYKAMRDDMVVWLNSGDVAVATQAATKVMRLSQITSGILGGIEDANIGETTVEDDFFEGLKIPGIQDDAKMSDVRTAEVPEHEHLSERELPDEPNTYVTRKEADEYLAANVQEIGHEKLDVILWFIGQRLNADPNTHMVVWFRFRQELIRMVKSVQEKFPHIKTGMILGGQKRTERLASMQLLHPSTSPMDSPVFVGGTFGTGAYGLNLTGASISVNCSFDYSLGKFLQSADRVYGPGQTAPVAYFDIIATGPKGERTIDHAIVAARRANESIANWVVSDWVKALSE